MIRRYLPKNVAELVHWYERYVSPLSLVAGFVADNLILLRRVDLWQTNALLFFYLVIAACGIVLIHIIESGRVRNATVLNLAPLIPVIVQFAFGGLFSGFLSLYSRSAAFATSWIFVLVLAGLLLGNERFTRLYVRLPFQISVYFAVLFSFLIFYLPVVFHQIGPYMFLLGGVVSVGLITVFTLVLWRVVPEVVKREQTRIARSIAVIFTVFNILYFSNAIPPLPLSLKDAGVYHAIVRDGGTYALTYEPVPWYESYLRYNTVFHQTPGEEVYVWSAVFAPSGLSTTIFHEWQHYDEVSHSWQTMSLLSFAINGGRDGGYRGYTSKDNLAEGAWRVNVITPYGQVIGRVTFTVENVALPAFMQESQE